jgi:hypothetical protein
VNRGTIKQKKNQIDYTVFACLPNENLHYRLHWFIFDSLSHRSALMLCSVALTIQFYAFNDKTDFLGCAD